MTIQNWTVCIVALASIIFGVYCFRTDSVGGGSNRFSNIFCRLVAHHVKLIFWLVIGEVLVWVSALSFLSRVGKSADKNVGGGFQTEQLSRFFNTITFPAQLLVYGVLNLLGIAALGILCGQEWITNNYDQHPGVYIAVAIVLYLVWLGYTVRNLVLDEIVTPGMCFKVAAMHAANSDVLEGFDAEQVSAFHESCKNLVLHKDAENLQERHAIWMGVTFSVWVALVISVYLIMPTLAMWVSSGS